MTPFVFDTLSASKQLRQAGMDEGVAEAVVSVFQHAAAMPDISHLATKDDLDALRLATKADLDALRVATKDDIDALRVATKDDIAEAATKVELEKLSSGAKAEFALVRAEMKAEFATLRAELNDKLRQQGWMLLGGVAVLLTISTAMTRVLAG